MSVPRRRRRGIVTALVAAALCLGAPPFASPPASGSTPPPEESTGLLGLPLPSLPGIELPGLPGLSLTLTVGSLQLSTGTVTANLANGANGPVLLAVGPCLGGPGKSCSGVLSEFWLLGSFKDAAGNPLYSDTAPAEVSWTCNAQTCPAPTSFVPGGSTRTELQVAEFAEHTIYFAERNPDGSFEPFEAAPACQGTTGASLPTGTIDRQDTGGRGFCVDVGAITRANEQCTTTCAAWAGPLTMPILFVEDPKFMGT